MATFKIILFSSRTLEVDVRINGEHKKLRQVVINIFRPQVLGARFEPTILRLRVEWSTTALPGTKAEIIFLSHGINEK
jgi:hypothetical protein